MLRIGCLCLAIVLLLAIRTGAAGEIWQEESRPGSRAADTTLRHYQADDPALRAMLQRVSEIHGPGSQRTIRLPMPDGSLAEFEIYESPVMADELAQRYPEIKTYKVYGIDDPIASGRLDITPRGFHAMLHTSQGRLFIDPETASRQPDRYLARTQSDTASPGYSCGVDDHGSSTNLLTRFAARPAARIEGSILEYRIAVSATEEYVTAVASGSVSGAQTEIVTAINRVNEIYERDLGIRLKLVSDNDQLIENGDNVDFTDGNVFRMLVENQEWIDSLIGSAGYDIGHLFSRNGGGLAFLGSACDDQVKANGVSGILNPVDDPFYIDFVAHEIGHQFNAEHSFNGTTLSCASGRSQATAFEPGSGSTIMAYANICGVEDLQSNSDATFHAGSIAQIDAFTADAGSCYKRIDANPPNPNYPVVSALADWTIPANTAFVLDGAASDADGDVLSYQWDQMDAGCSTNANSFGTDTGDNALFRSFLPRDVSQRHFPALGTQLQELYDAAEVIPCNNRDINLKLTARDGSSGVASSDLKVSVLDTGAAFEVTNLDTPQTIVNGETFTVNWNVASTDEPPINCGNVDIDLLTFTAGYNSYTAHPLSTTANSGAASVQIPAEKSHPLARIRVKCSNNVFYDISDADLVITGTDPGPDNFSDDANPVFFNNNGTTGLAAPVCGEIVLCGDQTPDNGDGGDDGDGDSGGGGGSGDSGAVDYQWLLLLTGILLLSLARRRQARGYSEA
jgi:hypothetical protein